MRHSDGSTARQAAAAVLIAVLVLGCGEKKTPRPPGAGTEPAAATSGSAAAVRGEELYAKQCASCHGAQGFGDGAAAYLLYPKPRDFSALAFRLISTDNGFPSDDDLFRTITNGMPGSAMPPWKHLSDGDRWALVHQVKKLTRDGKVARLVADGIQRAQAEEIADEQCVAGTPITLPRVRPVNDALLARGKAIYTAKCASCHDDDGRGRLKRDLEDNDGYPIFARDFTQGIFKGGAGVKDLAMRFSAGMPGTPMPSFLDQFESEDDLWAVVHYTRSFVEEGAQERVRQERRQLLAKKAVVGFGVDADAWRESDATWLALMPLAWRDDRIEGVRVQALHDGKRLALRLSWRDATKNDHQIGQRAFGDAAALQFSADADPPFFAMGARGAAVNIWHWKAVWEGDDAGFRDVEFSFPHSVWDVYQSLKEPPFGRHSAVGEFPTAAHDPLFLSGRGAGNPLSRAENPSTVEDLTAEGFGTLTSRARDEQQVRGAARWRDGEWSVVFVRNLAENGKGSVGFAAGRTLSIAFAVWDGSALDRDGQKSVTIWHRLTLQP